MNIGKNIEKYRKLAGYSKVELAEILGISRQRLSNWERGINKPDANFIAEICTALNVNADDFL